MSCARAKFTATYLGDKRLTPTPDELRALDAMVRTLADESKTPAYDTAINLLWYANAAAGSGFPRLPPIEEVREAKVRPDALGAEIETHLEGA